MDECSNLIYDETGGQSDMGQSDSKGARKRSKTPSGHGAAISFGFKKKGSKNAGNGTNKASEQADKNGNGGSTEELCTGSPVLSGRSTPLARPRKEASGQPLRTNRFGFRQTTIPKTAKVADINISAEQALTANQETKNNNLSDKNYAKPPTPIGLIPTQITSTGVASINPQSKKTKQTIILTYAPKQHPIVPSQPLRSKSPAVNRVTTGYQHYGNQRSASASRAFTPSTLDNGFKVGNAGKYTFQTTQLPKPQYPAVKVFDTKTAKQVANNSKKVYGSSDGSSKEGSMTEDSGVSGLGDRDGAWSPLPSRRSHRRPRTLEMIMQGDHNFHLRELQLNDLDIMDEAIVTDNDVIPLPKLPSTFEKKEETSSNYFQLPENRISFGTKTTSAEPQQQNRSNSSIMERYKVTRDNNRSMSDAEDLFKYKGEEKASRDRIQHEKLEKRDYEKMIQHSPLTRDSSKESSPSTKSDESHPSIGNSVSEGLSPWINQTAGESMALRSQDDISVALTLSSSCDDDNKDYTKSKTSTMVQTTVHIVDKEPSDTYASLTAHPMMMKSLSLSQHQALPSLLMASSMTSSAFTDTSSLVGNLLMDESRLRMANLTSSNHSLIEDETSPADSLISSSTDSNNEMPIIDRDATVSTSAYHTADNRTLCANKDDDTCMEDNLKDKDTQEKRINYFRSSPSKKSPRSPDTPTNASNSLSLSEGRDFLIDDEIADQPALIFEANSTADQATSSLQLLNLNTDTPTLLETLNQSALNKIKGLINHKTSSPKMPKRSPSLDTLSPCDSIASDDLIMDMDLNNSITSLNSVDEYIDRLGGSIRSGLNSLEDTQLRDELLKLSFRKYSSQVLNESIHSTPKLHHSTTASNTSLANLGIFEMNESLLADMKQAGECPTPGLVAQVVSLMNTNSTNGKSAFSLSTKMDTKPDIAPSVRRKKTDLHINEPILVRSSSPSPKLAPRVQKAQQYRTPLPVRTGRLLSRSRAGTPESPHVAEGGSRTSSAAVSSPGGTPDDALRLDRNTHGNMLHDIVTIKTMLLKLKRVLQEPDEEHYLLRTETHNPLDNQRDSGPLKNGPSLRLGEIGEASPPPPPQAPQEEVADLRRQLVFLQSQLEDRERLVKLLQQQMSKYSENQFVSESTKCAGIGNNSEETCNVATQTERLRPGNQGSILQSLTSDSQHLPGSIVSWNEPNRSRSIQSPYNHRQSSSSPPSPMKRHVFSLVSSPMNDNHDNIPNGKITNGTNGCNGTSRSRDSSPKITAPNSPVYIKSNCRVGSKYLQAITNNHNHPRTFHEMNGKAPNKTLHTRSKSIENFRTHTMNIIDIDDSELNGDQKMTPDKKHHKSHTNLYNGNGINYKNGHAKVYTNGNATDAEDNSDSGYKSLPPSINISNIKTSGIPRRTLTSELKTPLKLAQTNKC